MKNKKIIQIGAGVVAGAVILGSSAVLAFAATTTAAAKTKINQSSLVNRADTEIAKRITDLTNLSSRVADMKNVSDAEKNALAGDITTQITNLNTLKAEIGSSTDMATLKTDAASITQDNRIYALVIPKTRILAANDRAMTVINMLEAMAPKLQTRISDAQTAGKDVTTLNTALTDFNSKLEDATNLSGSIGSGILTLAPDQGNKTVLASNETALKAARKNLSLIQADLVAARKDVATIVKGVKGVGPAAAGAAISVPTATTSTPSTGTSTQ